MRVETNTFALSVRKYRQIDSSLWASYTFVYATLFRFILALASISTHSLAYTKVYKSYEHTNL